MKRLCAALLALPLTVALIHPAAADYANGAAAYQRADYAAALEEWRAPAEAGNAEAQLRLGNLYANGEGVKESLRNSTFWFDKAAKQGDLQSAYYLAEAYETGEGVPKDRGQAFDLYKGVAEAVLRSE